MSGEFHIFETMRWIPGSEDVPGGFPLGYAHFRRIHASARALQFPFRPKDIHLALENAVAEKIVPQRVRLAIFESSRIDVAVQDHDDLPEGTVWKVAVAETRLDSADQWLRHKTSNRAVYDNDRAAYCTGPDARCDELIYVNEHGDVCEGAITNVFAADAEGILRTPSLDSGLLPGVLRGQLLADGSAVEARLTLEDLQNAPALYVGNALRGLIPARL